MKKTSTDPLLISMQWAKLQSVVDEASATLLRTAFSRIVTEANDYTCALFDAKGDMRARGNNAVGLGVPFWLPGGGENHPDAILSEQSLWIDSRPIVQDGVIVEPPGLAKAAAQLVPRTGTAR